jgi:hypothetical protein
LNTFAAAVQHMRVNHRRSHILVPEKFLHSANIIACFYQVRCKRVP